MLTPSESLTDTLDLIADITAQADFSVSEALLVELPELATEQYQVLSKRLPEVWPMFIQETMQNDWMVQAKRQGKSLALSILLVTNAEIHELNRSFRDKDQATDVLTFTLLNDADPQAGWEQLPQWALGDVYVSLPWAKTAVEETLCNKKDAIASETVHFSSHLTLYILERIVHGILHLIGMHHDTMSDYNKVIAIQNKVIHGQPEPV